MVRKDPLQPELVLMLSRPHNVFEDRIPRTSLAVIIGVVIIHLWKSEFRLFGSFYHFFELEVVLLVDLREIIFVFRLLNLVY